MADRKKEVKEAQKAGESIIASQFGNEPKTETPSDIKKINQGYKTMEEAQKAKDAKNSAASKTDSTDKSRDDMFSLSYEDAKAKYGRGQGNNIYFMSKEQFERAKADWQNNQGSLVAQRFAEFDGKPYQSAPKKGKTWADVKSENGNNPAKIAEYLNNTPDYKPGDLTKKGMAEMGYKQGEDGKWTIDNVLDEIDNISASDKTIATAVESFTNPETGDVDEGKANAAINEYEQRLVELGAATYDKDGNFILKPTSKGKGWETWATLLSVGLSVIGIAMGIPIIPINFRAVTGKDARDAQIQALQTQYMNIKSDSAKTIDQMNADVGAGQIAQNNQEALAAQEKHAQATAATKDVIGAQTGAEKELIEKRTDEEIRKDEAQFKRDMQRLQKDQDFQLKLAALQQQYAKEMANLQSALSTGSAIDVMRYQNSGFLKDLEEMGMSFSDIASYMAAKNGISPSDKNWQRVKSVSDMMADQANAAGGILQGIGDIIPF